MNQVNQERLAELAKTAHILEGVIVARHYAQQVQLTLRHFNNAAAAAKYLHQQIFSADVLPFEKVPEQLFAVPATDLARFLFAQRPENEPAVRRYCEALSEKRLFRPTVVQSAAMVGLLGEHQPSGSLADLTVRYQGIISLSQALMRV